jgi:hypothetical protein
LYLGCIFAPMLLFFAVSGIWQMLGYRLEVLRTLSEIHTQHRAKADGVALGSPLLSFFVLMMAISFIVTTVLGVIMALKYGRSRMAAITCLAVGVVVPLGVVLLKVLG